jgi:hypothetical protein
MISLSMEQISTVCHFLLTPPYSNRKVTKHTRIEMLPTYCTQQSISDEELHRDDLGFQHSAFISQYPASLDNRNPSFCF